eukprot:TRINITY_DN17418_c0_g1_i2.p1 TRINITY_DN17418_c0_g1~~TRINITY_DN17418_c0_g1_i2.p1  ORF type:complete len:223 (+),score=35.68 TRINITY_DN17418_c0_g1_i2:13-681(+)
MNFKLKDCRRRTQNQKDSLLPRFIDCFETFLATKPTEFMEPVDDPYEATGGQMAESTACPTESSYSRDRGEQRNRPERGGRVVGGGGKPGQDVKTYLLRNIPFRATMAELQGAVDEAGFEGKYSNVSLPVGISTADAVCNRGYAFLTFRSAEDGARFAEEFDGYRFATIASAKAVRVEASDKQDYPAAQAVHKIGGMVASSAKKGNQRLSGRNARSTYFPSS